MQVRTLMNLHTKTLQVLVGKGHGLKNVLLAQFINNDYWEENG